MNVNTEIIDGGAKFKVRNIGLLAYPVGSVYISVNDTPPTDLFGGEWEKISQGRVIQGSDDSHEAGTTINAGLPNITGSIRCYSEYNKSNASFVNQVTGAFYWDSSWDTDTSKAWGSSTNLASGTNDTIRNVPFDASRCSAIYGKSSTVQPNAFVVNIWKRIS